MEGDGHCKPRTDDDRSWVSEVSEQNFKNFRVFTTEYCPGSCGTEPVVLDLATEASLDVAESVRAGGGGMRPRWTGVRERSSEEGRRGMGRSGACAAPTHTYTDGVIQQSRKAGRRGPDPLLIQASSPPGRVSCPGGASSRAGARTASPQNRRGQFTWPRGCRQADGAAEAWALRSRRLLTVLLRKV